MTSTLDLTERLHLQCLSIFMHHTLLIQQLQYLRATLRNPTVSLHFEQCREILFTPPSAAEVKGQLWSRWPSLDWLDACSYRIGTSRSIAGYSAPHRTTYSQREFTNSPTPPLESCEPGSPGPGRGFWVRLKKDKKRHFSHVYKKNV